MTGLGLGDPHRVTLATLPDLLLTFSNRVKYTQEEKAALGPDPTATELCEG